MSQAGSSMPWDDQAGNLIERHAADGRTLRKSCDRCYQQKLRCDGNKSALTRCMRCQRAGAICVYSARTNNYKQPNKRSNSNEFSDSWDSVRASGRTQSVVLDLNRLGDHESNFDSELLQAGTGMNLDDIFQGLPLPSPCTTASSASVSTPASTAGTTGISGSSISTGSFSSGHSSIHSANGSISSANNSMSLLDSSSDLDLSGRLAAVRQALEGTFRKVTLENQPNKATQDCMINQTLNPKFQQFSNFNTRSDRRSLWRL